MSSEGGPAITRRGMMLVLSSPSGAGKTTLARMLIAADPIIKLSVSVTTRARRPGEAHGTDYYFVSPEEFRLMVNRGELLENARVFDNLYGTPAKPVQEALMAGHDILFDIDWQGTQQLERTARDDLVRVFILPPSMQDLERRLKARAQDAPEIVARRMAKAHDEMSHWAEYDYVIVNHDIDQALKSLCSVVSAERLRRHRQTGLTDYVRSLQQDR
ncbi:MAG TPA: guanylate kinase [Alphaproteobacteria bacterium]|nr:guanylate kinase [Alphaproteobacteria bacterium]HAJ48261.1 guanylate kinase [Alphaproteobacteria bacterium]